VFWCSSGFGDGLSVLLMLLRPFGAHPGLCVVGLAFLRSVLYWRVSIHDGLTVFGLRECFLYVYKSSLESTIAKALHPQATKLSTLKRRSSPPSSGEALHTSDFFVNNTVDLKVFNTIYETSFDVGPEIRHIGLIASAVTESDDSDSDLPGDNDLLEDDLSSDDED
jgi:hypothetical protein